MLPPHDTLPQPVADAISGRLEGGVRPESVQRVGGGDINHAVTVTDSAGQRWFIKWNATSPAGMFDAELDGLRAMAEAIGPLEDQLRVPQAVANGTADGIAWLLMEFLAPAVTTRGGTSRGWEVRLGRGLAALHRQSARASRGTYGWRRDNYLGRLAQANPPSVDWAAYWRDHRIAPQADAAHGAGLLSDAERLEVDRFLGRTDVILEGASAEGASLLHGDLWGGNVMASEGGRAALYDPAVYRGHREVDLAMSELFGFPSRFMPAYRDAWPVDGRYDEVRRDAYQLYYLLAHVNLFGRGYAAGAMGAVRRVLARV